MQPQGGLNPEDISRLKFIRGAQLSPAATCVAYAVSRCDRERNLEFCEVRIKNLDSGVDRSLRSGDVFATHPRWAPDQRRLACVVEQSGATSLEIIEIETRSVKKICFPQGRLTGPAVWSPNGTKLAAVMSTRVQRTDPRRISSRLYRADGLGFLDDVRRDLVLVDPTSGTAENCTFALGAISYIEWNTAGTRLLALATPAAIPFATYSPRLYVLDLRSATANQILDDGWFITHARWLPDGEGIAVVGAWRSDVTIPDCDLWTVGANGANPVCRTRGLHGNVGLRMHHDMPIWDLGAMHGIIVADADVAYATVQSRGEAAVCAIRLRGSPATERIVAGERVCLLLDAARARNKLLYITSDIRNPTDLYTARASDGRAEHKLTSLNDEVLLHWYEKTELGKLRIESSDGLPLDGWYLRPKVATPAVPTVLFIHGGPFSSTGNIFRFDFHLLATNGIAVVFHNFRGSSGYGTAFSRAIMGDWGQRGFPDHMATVDAATSGGFADPARLGVWGASHGGFATCWLVGHTDRFRAALAEAAVTNFTTAYYLSDAPDAFARDLGGRPDQIPDVYRSRSPITYAGNCTTPTLLLHGEDDFRCPIEEAEQFHRALLDAGCTSELVRIAGAAHLGDSAGPISARVAQNATLLDWFKTQLTGCAPSRRNPDRDAIA